MTIEALAAAERLSPREARIGEAIARATEWLLVRVESCEWREASPIGFYFAKLWYFERLYPLIFSVGALGAVADLVESSDG